jgi:catechol 2,3-dioxygenase-like lactoylglutathione lyase family enzyme
MLQVMTNVAGIAHVVLRVSDWRQSARWYQEVLGFERVKAEGFTVFRHGAAPFAILLRPTEASLPPSASTDDQHIDHLALSVDSPRALELWQAALHESGVDVGIDRQPGIGASITLHDPDGLEIELFAAAAGSAMEVAQRSDD